MCIALNAMIASNTARAVLKSPLVLQTIIIAQMVSIGGKGANHTVFQHINITYTVLINPVPKTAPNFVIDLVQI